MNRLPKTLLISAACAVVFFLVGWSLSAGRHSRPERVVDAFHEWYHRNGDRTYNRTSWLGVAAQKCPLDLWVLQEIIHEIRPDVIVETGTYKGGSAYYYASLLDLFGHGRVVTVDIEEQPGLPRHDRITYLLGSSESDEILRRVEDSIGDGEKVMVLLDSDHSRDHVLKELRRYSDLVTVGSYLVVEDTHFNGNPILPNFGPGPMEAVQEFLAGNTGFEVDRSRERFGLTFNRSGYLRKVR